MSPQAGESTCAVVSRKGSTRPVVKPKPSGETIIALWGGWNRAKSCFETMRNHTPINRRVNLVDRCIYRIDLDHGLVGGPPIRGVSCTMLAKTLSSLERIAPTLSSEDELRPRCRNQGHAAVDDYVNSLGLNPFVQIRVGLCQSIIRAKPKKTKDSKASHSRGRPSTGGRAHNGCDHTSDSCLPLK